MALSFEVCVGDSQGLAAAVEGGADRIELTAALELGGLTPSLGFLRQAARTGVPTFAIIRPRPGDFVYSANELDVMCRDVEAVAEAGLAGIVVGASRPDGRLDEAALGRLVAVAGPTLSVALHRAFDLVPDMAEALDLAADLGIVRVLTSGGSTTALEGARTIAAAVEAAAGRVSVMAGGGVRVDTLAALLAATGVTDVHASCSVPTASTDPRIAAFGWGPPLMRRTDRATVEAMRHRLREIARIDQPI